jgi:predicted permease
VVALPRRTGAVLVCGQLALTLLLLICSGLFVRTLQNLRTFDRGFDPEGVLLVEVDGRTAGYTGAPLSALYEDLRDGLQRLAGVRSVSYSGRTPLASGETSLAFVVNGVRLSDESLYHAIGARYFETIRTPIAAGREFTASDSRGAPKVAVVNEAFAKKYSKGAELLGQRLSIAGDDGPPMQIVGIVRDAFVSGSARYFVAPSSVFVPYAQSQPSKATFEIAVTGAVADVAGSVRRELSPRLQNMRVEVRTMGEQLDRVLLQERLVAGVGTTFGALALVLAVIGLYGLLAYNVACRRTEIGVRAALGATRSNVLRLIMADAVRALALGIFIGVPLAWLAAGTFSRMLFGLTATDPSTLAASIATLAVSALVAAYFPARRAMNVDPVDAMRVD